MKNIIPALNKVQLACMDTKAPLTDIGKARKELFAAIREAIIDGMNTSDQSIFLAKFDKLNGD